jgi:hypothetical protein
MRVTVVLPKRNTSPVASVNSNARPLRCRQGRMAVSHQTFDMAHHQHLVSGDVAARWRCWARPYFRAAVRHPSAPNPSVRARDTTD